MRRLGIAFVLAACGAGPKVAPPAVPIAVAVVPGSPMTSSSEGMIVPCRAESADAVRAEQVIAALGAQIDALHATDGPGPSVSTLEALLATPCFALARADDDVKLSFDSGASLRTWWGDGGHDWIHHYIAIEAMPDRFIVGVPPTPRTTMALETRAKDPLAPLLCPLKAIDDHACGVETAGWRIRVDRSTQQLTNTDTLGEHCATRARRDTSGTLPYSVFRACLHDGALSDMLPLGAYQAPKDGWLLVAKAVFISIAGCREAVSAYDLATGSAYIVGCRDSPPARLYVGRVPTGALREAAWMMMLQHTHESVRRNAEWFDVPKDFPVARRAGERLLSQRVVIDSTDDSPIIDWAWIRKGAAQVSGRFETQSSSHAGHAASLLTIANAAFQEGCAPASLPASFPWGHLAPTVGDPASDPNALFSWVDDAKAMLASAPRSTGACPLLP